MTAASSALESRADFGTRFSAFVIDALVLFSMQWIVFIVLSRQLQAVGLTSTEPCVDQGVALCEGPSTILWALLLVVYVVTTVGYHTFFEGRFGATPGKYWMGLQVVNLDGLPIDMGSALARSLVRQLFWLTPLVMFEVSPLSLGLPAIAFVLLPALAVSVFVLGAFRSDARAGHDLVARTMVVRRSLQAGSTPPSAQPKPKPLASKTAQASLVHTPDSDDLVAADDEEDLA